MDSVRVFCPATIANVACGFDIFGFAIDQPGDEIIVRKSLNSALTISAISGDKGLLPMDPNRNVAGVSIAAFLKHLNINEGLEIEVHKKMPLGSGLGSSAASSVGAVFAANALIGNPLSTKELLPFALKGELIACGTAHADNVAPALLGGFVMIRSYDPLDVISIPINLELACAVLYPHVEVLTNEARKILPETVTLKQMVQQTGNAAALIAGLTQGNASLVQRALVDVVIEEVRAPCIPGFNVIKQAALDTGALGCSISGSGPSIFALTSSLFQAKVVGNAMKKACSTHSNLYVSQINTTGAKVIE